MLFNSFHFLLFLPLTVLLYFSLSYRFRWVLLLTVSYYFYACWKLEYLILIILSTLIDYYCGLKMSGETTKTKRLPFLYISLASNLGLLLFFKYANFLGENITLLLNQINISYTLPSFELLLPLGISFYTFQTISYSIDVYNEKIKAETHLGRFAVFVSFFPQLVAGPIERSQHLLPQFSKQLNFDSKSAKLGIQQMLWGFFKKLVIADNLAPYVDLVYANPDAYTGLPIILATLFFAFQIYCDFSGYTDIAIGAAKILGYDLMENFRQPYFAYSITDFWRRWHISLSSWFKDYVYIPLGGNKTVKWRWYYNLMTTFIISGFWHGANWTFIIWGALFGIFIILEKTIRFPIKSLVLKTVWTFSLVCFAWIFFRAESIQDVITLLQNALHFENTPSTWIIVERKLSLFIALFGILIVLIYDALSAFPFKYLPQKIPILALWTWCSFLLWMIVLYGDSGNQSFIYFTF